MGCIEQIEEYLITINLEDYFSSEIEVEIKREDVVNILWHLKTLIRCKLKKISEEESCYRYAFGSGKKDLGYMSRILFTYDLENKSLKMLCLLKSKDICDKILKLTEDVFKNIETPLTYDSFKNKFMEDFIQCARSRR
ncbi:type III-G CRISPR-associated protein Csx26 [Sulfolobus sp. E11-6]|uniref:type III-G CRISPR-associated protein Csx26 n=1 Tax=Sulfolobus sp. E11-6 TaxID=2663020 RepID=UPI001297067F|nr:hypothetical protein [Sulfolobus sp. E11-6]QGA68930.1 hypothetical protein GFS33_09570 [Sulfolobus sp. E11-6]